MLHVAIYMYVSPLQMWVTSVLPSSHLALHVQRSARQMAPFTAGQTAEEQGFDTHFSPLDPSGQAGVDPGIHTTTQSS